jgi:beta-lactamase class A
MLQALQRLLIMTLLVTGGLYLAYQGLLYVQNQDRLPPGTAVAGVNVSGLTLAEAEERLTAVYNAPVRLHHRYETIDVLPADVDFQLDMDTMLQELVEQQVEREPWQGFIEHVVGQSLTPVQVELRASHSREAAADRLYRISRVLDDPPQPPTISLDTDTFSVGSDGYVTDLEASLPLLEAALYRPAQRQADLIIVDMDQPELDMAALEASLQKITEGFGGIVSAFVIDLETGEELSINGDVAISGLSILKIPIFIETYRALTGEPNETVQRWLYETAVQSSNFGANNLLHVIAGENNTYQGAHIFTEQMRQLGMVNTFMAIPYDAPVVQTRPSTFVTPANSDPNSPTRPDPARQTTAEEMGTMLSMLYYCAQGTGGLLAVYNGQISPADCQAIIDLMILNIEGNLIRFGVPADVPVSHKHGWDGTTYGDAGIVLSPGGHYVLVYYVTQNTGWLSAEISFPLMWEMSRVVYNYFNPDAPYLEDAWARAEREALWRGVRATAVALDNNLSVLDRRQGTAVNTNPIQEPETEDETPSDAKP